MKTEEATELHCVNCRRKIDFGRELVTVEKAVKGPRGIVPLGESLILCGERCVVEYFDDDPRDLPKYPPRIP